METIYLDHGATTPVRKQVVSAMQPYWEEVFGNPSAIYQPALDARKAVTMARKQIADSLRVDPEEIYFTSGGTESDNWVLKTLADQYPEGGHIITSSIEHHAILESCKYLESKGFTITYLPVDATGTISIEQLEKAIRPDTIFITIMYANNEIGTVQPVKEIGKIARKYKIPFHTDAVQAYMHVPLEVNTANISMMSASGHKFGGPKGIGFLYIKKTTPLYRWMHGGGQEFGKRAGTENVPGIVGMATAVELAVGNAAQEQRKILFLRDRMIRLLLREIPYIRINGSRDHRLPGNVNVSFQFVEGHSLLLLLNEAGICASAGAACSGGEEAVSHVLQAIGIPDELARGTVRFSIGAENTTQQIDTAIECVKESVQRLRQTGISESLYGSV